MDESASGDDTFLDIAEICLNNWQRYDPECTCYISLANARIYIEKMIQGLDVDAKFKIKASKQLAHEPAEYSF